MCLIPFEVTNELNSLDVNWAPLSDTICCGSPNLAKINRSALIVDVLVAESIGTTSGHLLWASTTTRNILSRYGPAKSIWSRHHGFDGHSQG